tara:strand:+ start:25 stop:381 length:357 start_codon:yes stop_codon:yes gene_type:complete
MTAVNQDFSMHSGDSKTLSLIVKDEDGIVVNLTGLQKAQLSVKNYPNSTSALISKTLGSGVTNNTPSTGELLVSIDSVSSGTLSSGDYYYEVRIKDTNGNIGTVTTGTITIKEATPLS